MSRWQGRDAIWRCGTRASSIRFRTINPHLDDFQCRGVVLVRWPSEAPKTSDPAEVRLRCAGAMTIVAFVTTTAGREVGPG
jgi:hypothetical protein